MSDAAVTAVELAVRVSVVFVTGAAVALALHRQAASVRHLAWSATLAGSLLLALLVPWAPSLDVPMRGWNLVRQAPDAPLPERAIDSHRVSLDRTALSSPRFSPPSAKARIEAGTNRLRAATVRRGTPFWLLAWMAGGALVLTWGVIGRLGLTRIAQRAIVITDGPWHRAVADAARTMRVERPIRICASIQVGAPVTWGVRRPILVVPATSDSWSDEVRRSVAAHEVAHIARNDYLQQLSALAACAVYWFHPLVWVLARRMRLAAEQACDDLVLMQGTTGEEYAAHLIGVARGSRALRLAGAVAIGMARPSTLEGRIMAVLDSTIRRGEPSRRAKYVAFTAGTMLLVSASVVRPAPAAAREPGSGPATLPPVFVPVPTPVSHSAPPVAGAAGPVAAPEQGNEGRQNLQDEVRASPGELLDLDLDAGGSVYIRSWDEDRVQVRTQLGGADWRDVDVRVDRQSSGVSVQARVARSRNTMSTNNRFDIRVPRRFDVRIRSSGGHLSIVDVEGRFTGHVGGGGLTLERLTGSASLSIGGGEIRVSDSNLSGRVSTGGGLVMLSKVSGGLRGSSGSGPVIHGDVMDERPGSGSNARPRETGDLSSVNVTGGGSRIDIGRNTTYRAGTLHIEKAGGDIVLNAAPNGARVHTGGGDIRVGESRDAVSAHTGGGDVQIGPASASVEAGTGAGEVRIVIDRVTPGQVIEAWSGKGRVIIELPRDFDGRLELETAHTRTHEETARISSDFDIDREPLTDWDDRQGTPRRYLRASGRIGRGDARVVVRTVNGEIEIRRR